MKLEFTGISDEGAVSLNDQIKMHRDLGWNSLEIRTIDGKNISEMPDEDFEKAYDILQEEDMKVVGFASSIANWARPVGGDFELDKQDLLRSAPRMHRLGTSYLRIMSYTQGDADKSEWKFEALKRVKEMSRIAEGEGITLIHENCDGWASQTPENLEEMLTNIPSEALRVVFDMGNPRGHGHRAEAVWDFVKACENRIAHIHIKDCYLDQTGEVIHCFPGEGECQVAPIIKYMVEKIEYSGYLSIEPHMVFSVS